MRTNNMSVRVCFFIIAFPCCYLAPVTDRTGLAVAVELYSLSATRQKLSARFESLAHRF
jgi:hypothetical protein